MTRALTAPWKNSAAAHRHGQSRREAVAPSTIKRQVTEYVRESGDNQLHAAAARARIRCRPARWALVSPIRVQLMRAIPAPFWIGAGLALSRSTALREATGQAMTQARDTVAEATDSARDALHDMRDAAGSVLDRGSELVSSVTEGISNTARDATASIKGGADTSRAPGGEALNAAGEKITTLASQTKETLNSAYDHNPLLIAGIGLAVGAFIASSLPSTQVENRVFGDTSEKLRRRAADAAAQGLDTAKQVANNVVEAAAQQGLSGEGLAAAAGGITQKARAVAERGVKAALGDRTP